MSRSRSRVRFHRSHATRLLALGMAITLVPTALGAPADIAEIAAPVIGADPPKAQDIPDGDVSVATQTGSLNYSYPIKVPPGRGMAPSLALSYSSQAPIYGGPAAGWQLSIPMIQWDTSKGRMRYAHYADLAQSPEWDEEPFVSSLSGGRPLVRVTGDPDGQNFRAKNDSSWIRYERHQQLNDPEGDSARWIARTPEGVTHYFGEGAFITNLSTVETVDLTRVRAPLTRSVDQFGNTIEYNWDFEDGELRIALIRYTVNEASGVDPFAEVSFVYGTNPSCAGIPVGSQTDYRTNVAFVDGASRLVQIVAKALDPATSAVKHTRQIDLAYDSSTETCTGASSPYRQLSSIQERAWHAGETVVVLPPVSFVYGTANIELGEATTLTSPFSDEEPANLGWGHRYRTDGWPTVEAMMIDLDGDGLVDRLFNSTGSSNDCEVTWQRNFGGGSFTEVGPIQLPRLPWQNWEVTDTKATGERCAVNYQRTLLNNVIDWGLCNPDQYGSYLVYRWMDMGGDGLPDLVTAIQHDAYFDPSDTNVPTPTGDPWPSCSGDRSACPALLYSCMLGARECPTGQPCEMKPNVVEACIASADNVPCHDMTLAKQGGSGDITAQDHTGCSKFDFVDGFELACGLYPWTIYKNLGGGQLSEDPETILQPIPLESDTGDTSLTAGGYVGQQQSIIDVDGDGFLDVMIRGRWNATGLPPDIEPFWWWGFLGDGLGGFVKDPVSGIHEQHFFQVHEGFDLSENVRSWVTPYSSYLVSSVEQLADMNGDGSVDMLRHFPSIEEGDPGSLHLHFNDGLALRWTETLGPDRVLAESLAAATSSHFVVTDSDGTDPNKRWIIDATRDAWNRLIDVDEDGRLDLYQLSSEGDPQIFHNVGGDVAGPVLAADEMRPGLAQKMVTEGENWASKSDLIDLDGDGIPESIDFAAFEQAKYDPAGAPPRLLTHVDNGRGATTEIVYAPLSDTDVVENSPASTADPNSVASPRTQWVVASVETSDAFESTTSKTTYFYDDPVFNADDEGRFAFRGFKTVKAEGPRGDLTIQRYGFGDAVSPDWSGRLIETVTMLEADEPATVHSIARQSWTENTLFGGVLETYHPLDARTYRCKPSQTEAACEADPAGFVLSRSSWAAKAAGGTDLLYVENETATQDSEAFDDGDRKTTRQFALFTTGDVYRLRETKSESFEQVSSVDVLFASTETVWDGSYRVPSEIKRLLDGVGTLAITEQDFDMTTGNLETVRKPEQVEANSSAVSTSSYDSRKLFVADVVNELGHSNQRDYEYGTGAVVEERGPNHPNCPDPPVGCPASGLPQRDGSKTKVDGFGRPLEIEVTSMYPGYPQVFQWSKVETFAYTDAPAGAVPAHVVDSKRINFDADRWTSVITDMDGHGRPIKTTEKTYGTTSVDAITTYDYDAAGKLVAVAVPDPSVNTSAQVTFTYSFDSIGRPTGMRRPDATDVNQRSGIDVSYAGLVETRLEVPGAGGQTSGQAPAMTTLESDSFGRLIKVNERVSTGPDVFAETTYAFSPRDEVKTIVSVAGQPDTVTTELEHDLGGRRTAITRGDRTWRYAYDRNDNLVAELAPSPDPGDEPTDAAWTSTFAYDAADRMTSKAIAQRDLSSADLDLFGASQAILEWDGTGNNGFNRVGRLVFYDTQGPSEDTVFRARLYYDPEGHLRMDDRDFNVPVTGGTVAFPYRKETYKFDPFGKIKTVTNADETATEDPSSVQTRYDDRGNPEDLVLVRPGMTSKAVGVQTRNVAGLVTKRKSSQSGVGMTFVESVWAYDKLGRVTSQTVQRNGTPSQIARQDLTYWGNDDPKSLDHWIGSTNHKKFEYSYDQRHQLVGVSETAAGGAFAATYQFGRAGRFTDATVTPTALTGREVRPRNVHYVYGAADPEIVTELNTPIGGGQYTPYAEYEYDTVGNQTARRYFTDASLPTPQTLGTAEQWDFLYDGEDQLRRVTTPGTSGVIEEYWYNHEGNRTLVRTRSKSGSGPVTWRWFHNHTEVEWQTDNLSDTTAAQGQTIAYAVMGTPVARILDRNDRTEFQFHGLASSTLATVESGIGVLETGDPTPPASGTTNTAFIYSPFGEVLEAAGAEVGTHKRRYNDKYDDSGSGLTYYGYRYYDKVAMTWTQADPSYRFEPDAAYNSPRLANLYTSDLQNPLRYTDPDGRAPVPGAITGTGCAIGGQVGCGVGAVAEVGFWTVAGLYFAGEALARPFSPLDWGAGSKPALAVAVAAAAATASAMGVWGKLWEKITGKKKDGEGAESDGTPEHIHHPSGTDKVLPRPPPEIEPGHPSGGGPYRLVGGDGADDGEGYPGRRDVRQEPEPRGINAVRREREMESIFGCGIECLIGHGRSRSDLE